MPDGRTAKQRRPSREIRDLGPVLKARQALGQVSLKPAHRRLLVLRRAALGVGLGVVSEYRGGILETRSFPT